MGPVMQAVARHLGMDEAMFKRAEMVTEGDYVLAVFEVLLGEDDMIAVGELLKQARDGTSPAPALARVEIPSYEDMLRGPIVPQDVYEQDRRVRERVHHIAQWGIEFDAMTSSVKATFGSRFNYLLKRAREEDAIAAGVTSNADDFGGMPG